MKKRLLVPGKQRGAGQKDTGSQERGGQGGVKITSQEESGRWPLLFFNNKEEEKVEARSTWRRLGGDHLVPSFSS